MNPTPPSNPRQFRLSYPWANARALQFWDRMATISRMKNPIRKLLVLTPLVLACGDGGGKGSISAGRAGGGKCGMPGDSAIALAVTAFVKTVSPTPQRFLAAVSSDSAIPDAARAALQDRGPTYLWPPDSIQRAKVRQKLISVGDYTALAVVYKGMSHPDASHTIIKLGGHFVDVGNGVPPSVTGDIEMACDSTKKWRVVPKPPPVAT